MNGGTAKVLREYAREFGLKKREVYRRWASLPWTEKSLIKVEQITTDKRIQNASSNPTTKD